MTTGVFDVQLAERHPTLYLLHGIFDDRTGWLRCTNVERYAAELGIAIVVPQVHLSFYSDMAYGSRYWRFLSEELQTVARSFFPLSDKREDNFVAGLSMGGYGALKWALNQPEKFAAAASLSGALHLVGMLAKPEGPSIFDIPEPLRAAFTGMEVKNTLNDLFWLLEQSKNSQTPMPQIYQCCGTEDFLYEDNLLFRSAAEKTNLDYTYTEEPGAHTWEYWDMKIKDILQWLPLQNRPSLKPQA